MLRLVIEDDEGKTTVVPLIRDEITIGRKEGNTIRLTERNVSRRHARLLRMGTGDDVTVIVEDLDSYNGIRLNGDRIAQKCTIRPGDLIQIGDYALSLQLDKPSGRHDRDKTTVGRPPAAAVDDAPTALHRVPELETLAPEEQGKLVVVSSNLAGETWVLDRREVIIGRTDENDVVVNHRSISRNHAKIIYRDGSFTIIDLASSNGVKVNGEELRTASLVGGDIIELGHVKLRFVAPGEDYVFTPADVDDVEVEAPVGAGRLILLGLLLVGVAVAAFFVVRSTDRPEPPPAAGSGTQSAAPAPVASAPVDPPAAPGADVEALMAEGRAHLAAEKWSEAASVFGRVLQSDPDHTEARELRNQANREAENERRFERIRQHVDDKQWVEAFFGLQDFPRESVYTPRVDALRPTIEKGYAEGERERAALLVENGELDAARKLQEELAKHDFARDQVRAIARLIRDAERPEELPPSRRVASRRPVPRTGPIAPPPAARPARAAPAEDYDDLMQRSLALIATGHRKEAAALLERARHLRPGAKAPHQRLCAIYRPLGQLEKALFHCKKWHELEQNGSYRLVIERTIQSIEKEMGH